MTEHIDEEGGHVAEVPPRRRGRDARMVASGVVAVLLLWFALANLQDVQIHFWVASAKAPLIGVIVIAGVFGGVIGALVRHRRRSA